MSKQIKYFKTETINSRPTVNDKVHESIFRSSHILEQVKTMLRRNDSNQTIIEFINECEQ